MRPAAQEETGRLRVYPHGPGRRQSCGNSLRRTTHEEEEVGRLRVVDPGGPIEKSGLFSTFSTTGTP